MADLSAILLAALAGGFLATLVRLPPLVGFLAAGFALNATGVDEPDQLQLVADLGVTILLFGVGLKLDVRTLIRREVAVTATAHMLVMSGLAAAGVLALVAGLDAAGVSVPSTDGWKTALLVGFGLSFSSTVLVVKLLEERGGARSLSGRTAVGVLVVQDIAAVVFLALAHDEPPRPWAVALVLLVPAAFLVRPVLRRLGHTELRPLFGLVAALVPGYALFDAAGLKGDLGALVVGMLLAVQPGAGDLSKSVLALKDLLLVAFFLSIGFVGVPEPGHLLLAALLLLLLPLKGIGFAILMWFAGFRRRTSVRGATTLSNYSEFGLIVALAAPASVLDDEWLLVLATTVAASFVASSALGRRPDAFVQAARRLLPDRPPERLHPEDRPIDVADAQAVVLGMGRVGTAAYTRLTEQFGVHVLGVESNAERVDRLRRRGLDVVEGDATDPEFWARIRSGHVDLAVLAMPFHSSNVDALVQLHAHDFAGTVAVVAQYDQDLEHARQLGARTGVQLYDGAGAELADRGAAAAGFESQPSD